MQGIGGFVPRVKLSLRMTRVSWRRHLLSFKWLVSGQEWGANLCLMQANPTDLWQRHASKRPGQALATSPVLPMILESFSFQSHLSVVFLYTRSRRKIKELLCLVANTLLIAIGQERGMEMEGEDTTACLPNGAALPMPCSAPLCVSEGNVGTWRS